MLLRKLMIQQRCVKHQRGIEFDMRVSYLMIPFLLSYHLSYGGAVNKKESIQGNMMCDACYSVKGELVKTTKFSLLSSDKKYTIIEMKNGDVYVHDGDLILGPVGLEIEIVASPSLDSFPPELRSVYSHATTAIKVNILSFPSGIEGIRFTP